MAQAKKWTEAKGKVLVDYLAQADLDRLAAGDPYLVDIPGTDTFIVVVPPSRHAEVRQMSAGWPRATD